MRLLVVGGSKGIGRRFAEIALASGHSVVVAARNMSDPPIGSHGFTCDVRDPNSCEQLVDFTLSSLGGLDGLLYTAGVSPLSPLGEAKPDLWNDVFNTNVVGAATIIRFALKELVANCGKLILISSTMVGKPWPGLVPYSSSRAALVEFANGLRVEFPKLRVTTATVGPTQTGFESNWEPNVLEEAINDWRRGGYLKDDSRSLDVGKVASCLLSIIDSPVRIDKIDLLPDRQNIDRN